MSCEKVRYATRERARRARKRIGNRDLRPYRCLICIDECWHLGHLADTIRRGDRSRAEVYGDEAA